MSSAPIDDRTVRRLFDDPQRLSASAFIRREIAKRMFEKLELVKLQPAHILDAGCGSGEDLSALRLRYPQAQMVGLDGSFAALRQVQQQHQTLWPRALQGWLPQRMRSQVDWLCGDFSRLPLQTQAVDLLWSNLALHWHAQPDLVLAEWRRVLRRDGLLMFSCFGPDSLLEVRHAFDGIDDCTHALPFVDMHDYGDMLMHAGFATPVMDMEKITLTYTSASKLLEEVRALGGNPLLTRRKGLLGKAAWTQVQQRLEALRNRDGRIPLTLEVVYGHAFRPEQRKLESGEAIIRLDIKKK